jgi:hypothetical protein
MTLHHYTGVHEGDFAAHVYCCRAASASRPCQASPPSTAREYSAVATACGRGLRHRYASLRAVFMIFDG